MQKGIYTPAAGGNLGCREKLYCHTLPRWGIMITDKFSFSFKNLTFVFALIIALTHLFPAALH